jgi:hypothetical protein
MRAITVKNGIVSNCAEFKDGATLPKGWVECPEGVGIGFSDNGDGTFSAPVVDQPEKTIEQQIADLECQVTARNLRGAALGDQYAIDHIQSVEDQVEALRAQL